MRQQNVPALHRTAAIPRKAVPNCNYLASYISITALYCELIYSRGATSIFSLQVFALNLSSLPPNNSATTAVYLKNLHWVSASSGHVYCLIRSRKQNYKQEDESLARLWDDREMVSCILLANILI